MNLDYDELKPYRSRLKEANEDNRLEIYQEVEDLGIPKRIPILIEGLSDSSQRVQSAVAKILTQIGNENVIGRLLECLREEDPGLRSRAMTILPKLGIMILNPVEACLSDKDTDIRIFATTILGNTGLKEAFPALKKALADPEENVRYAVVEAMGKIGIREAIPLLMDMLKDKWARYPAVESLGYLKARESIPYLLNIYAEDGWVRHVVIEALGNIADPGPVNFLIKQMNSNNEMIQQAALTSLAKIEEIHVTGIFDQLQEMNIDIDSIISSSLKVSEPAVRRSAIWCLGLIGNESHIPLLLEQLASFDEYIRPASRQALVNMGSRHLKALLEQYDGQEEHIQREFIEILGKIGNKASIPLIVTALHEGNKLIRETAAKTLAVFKDRSMVDPLISGLKDPAEQVRSACAFSLGILRAVKGTRHLMPLLEDPEADVRESASEALGRIGTIEIAKHAAPLLNHPQMEVRQAAIQCLGLIMDRRVNSYLIDALNNADRGVRRFAANIIGKRNISAAAERLIVALMDEDWQVRKSAASALGNLREERSIDVLLDSLKDDNIWVRYASVVALGKIGNKKAALPLQKCLKNDTGPVLIATVEALLAMNAPDIVSLLIPLSENPDEEVRKVIAETLGKLKDKKAMQILEKMKRDPHPMVKQAAITACNDIGIQEADFKKTN